MIIFLSHAIEQCFKMLSEYWAMLTEHIEESPSIFVVQWNLGYTSKSGLKNSDIELRETYKWK